jgi:hypothetical protein
MSFEVINAPWLPGLASTGAANFATLATNWLNEKGKGRRARPPTSGPPHPKCPPQISIHALMLGVIVPSFRGRMVMAAHTLTVSFEILWEATEQGRADYSRIYDALNEAIRSDLPDSNWWSENTSYFVIHGNEDAATFLIRIWTAANMRADKDRMVVLDANIKTGAAYGNFNDQTLFSLLPFVKKLVPAN